MEEKRAYLEERGLKASNPYHPVYSLRVRWDVRVLLSIHNEVLIIHVLETDYRKRACRDF